MKGMRSILWVILLALIPLIGCDESYSPDGPVPEALLIPAAVEFSPSDVDAAVDVVYTEIPSAAPRTSGTHGTPPSVCDFVKFQRYMPKTGYSGSPMDADACLLMMPGVIEGANGFDYIGRNMVYIAKTQYNMNIEVWAMDRRNNCLEDLTGVNAAAAAATAGEATDLAIGYYYNGMTVNGKTFKGFLSSKDVPFMSEFGLKMDTNDMFTIIRTMVPDATVRKNKVFVGGHSMGGTHAAIFAGWDLDGNPETLDDAGFNNTAGLFAFDSTVVPIDSMVDDVISQYIGFIPKSVTDYGLHLTKTAYASALYGLKTNLIPRFVNASLAKIATGSPLDAEIMDVVGVLGVLAVKAPDEENTAIREIPMSDNMKSVLANYLSRDKVQLETGIPSATDFRFTNEALLGIFFDDDFSPITMIKTSLGFLNGGAIVEKDPELGFTGLFVPADAGPDKNHLGQGPLYTWANYNETASPADPLYQDTSKSVTFTTIDDEVADIQAFARALYAGNTNLIEWYFSTRRLIDLMAIISDYNTQYGLNYIHSAEAGKLPSIEFPAGDGMFGAMGAAHGFEPLVGFNHMDPMFAAANTPEYRENKVIYPLLDFVAAHKK